MREFLLSFFVVAALAPTHNANSVRHALEARYQHARTLKAAFFERYSDGNGGVQAESGTVYFSRPGRMRWEYESPEPKLFLVDGKNAWFYVPADHTASRAKMKESSDWRTPIALLAGKADLSQLCRTIEVVDSFADSGAKPGKESPAPGNTVLRCTPRGESAEAASKEPIFLETDPEAHLVRVVIRQPGNVRRNFASAIGRKTSRSRK